ncbi:MAG TPA: LysM domain-containing protein, partial [Gammaproteobacteria bacterium]|nr:LysM domain-containing protein [Gammaproteobacteria bacterium]
DDAAEPVALAAVDRSPGRVEATDVVAAGDDAATAPAAVVTDAVAVVADAGAAGADDVPAVADAGAIAGADVPAAAADDAEPEADDENEEASLDSNALASNQAELAADPSDYSVSADDTITVQSLETLGHYADWLEIKTQRLRDLNRLPFRQAVVIGETLKLDFSRVSQEDFERRRTAYHRAQQEAFFSHYRIAAIEDHVVRRGESLWVLARRSYDVPVWLLRQYNPDLDLDHVAPGTVVKFPKLVSIDDDDGGTKSAAPRDTGVV